MSSCAAPGDVVLEIQPAYQEAEENLRFVRLPTKVILELDVLIEDVVQIEGGPLSSKMDVLVWPAYPEDEGRAVCRTNAPVMKALELKAGDLVTIRISPFQAASKQRKEHVLHHNIAVRSLTEGDLATAQEENISSANANQEVFFSDFPAVPSNAATPVDDSGEDSVFAVPGEDGSIVLVGCEDTGTNNPGKPASNFNISSNTSTDSEDEEISLDLDIASELDRKATNFKKNK